MKQLLVLSVVVALLGGASAGFAQTARGPEFRINAETEGHQMLPQVAMNALGEFVVVWGSRERQGELGEISLHARRFAADGTPETDEILVHENVGNFVETAVAMMADGSFVVVYAGGLEDVTGEITSSVFEGRRFAADGAPLGGPFAIGPRRNAQNPSIAARPEGGFVVAWEARRQGREVFVRIFDGDGSPVRSEIPLAPGENPAIAVGPEGEIVVAWMATEPAGGRRRYFVALQRLSPEGALEGRRIRVSNNAPQSLSGIRVAKDQSGSFFVLWNGTFNHVLQGILGQRFSSNGARLGRLLRLDSSQLGAEITLAPNGGFILVWHEVAFPDDLHYHLDVYRRTFRPGGGRSRQAFPVNTTRPGRQGNPDVADDGAGNFVVVWESGNSDGTGGDDIFARLYRR